MSLKDDYISSIGHDLRSPIATAYSCFEFLLDTKLSKSDMRMVKLGLEALNKSLNDTNNFVQLLKNINENELKKILNFR